MTPPVAPAREATGGARLGAARRSGWAGALALRKEHGVVLITAEKGLEDWSPAGGKQATGDGAAEREWTRQP